MIAELWESFPRLMERNIDALLDDAEPRATKAFQLFKSCQREDLWHGTFDDFSRRLRDYYAKPRFHRRKSQLDAVLDRPMDHSVYADFHLNFRSAIVSALALHNLADWAHHLIRVGFKSTSAVISKAVLLTTLQRITNPLAHEKAENIDFEDFCAAWKKAVFQEFGKSHDEELSAIVTELRWLNAQIEESEKAVREKELAPAIYLTQTEIDWVLSVQSAALEERVIPKFPLSRGPQKPRLIEIDKAASLYNLVYATGLPELLRHRDRIRATLIDRCESLLREKAA